MKRIGYHKRTQFKTFTMSIAAPLITDVFHSQIACNPLQQNSSSIETFLQLIKTAIGPYGKLKMIQNSNGGYVTTTSISTRLLKVLTTNSLILRMIISAVKSHLSLFNNGGLHCCLFMLSIIKNSMNISIPFGLSGELHQCFGLYFTKILDQSEMSFYHEIDFSVSHLQKIICSILNSKPSCLLTTDDKYKVSLLLLKAFSNVIPTESHHDRVFTTNIGYVMQLGLCPSKSSTHNGLLLKLPDSLRSKKLFVCSQRKSFLVAVFSVSLAGDVDFNAKEIQTSNVSVWKEVLSRLQAICQRLISDGIQIVFCQRVVHPTIKKQLEDNGVLIIDRLGFEIIYNVERITGASLIMSLSEATKMTYGMLDKAQVREIDGKKLLFLENENYPFCTIQLCNFNEDALNETKLVCQQVIDTLFRILKKPIGCSGGGCTETVVAHYVKLEVLKNLNNLSKDYSCSTSTILESLQAFLASVYDVALSINQGTRLHFVSETAHHHLWRLHDGTFPHAGSSCQCGMYTADHIASDQWYFLNRSSSIFEKQQENCASDILFQMPNVLDEMSVKKNAYSVACETASSLLQISLSIASET